MKRVEQVTLIISFFAFCWLGMQAVHELGHILGARFTGGTICKVVLYPTTISRTEVFPNPHPLIEVGAGPAIGSILPLLVCALAAVMRCPGLYLFRFFAGFCLVANGGYLLAGSFEAMGDPGELLRHGARLWQLIMLGSVAAALGFYLWNGLGRRFGLGTFGGKVDRTAVVASFLLLLAVCGLEHAFGHR